MQLLDEIRKSTWNKKIEMFRILKGWSQREAAEKCCTNQKVYWSWEMGISFPRKNSQRAIAMAFEVSVEEIFGSESQQKHVG